jgi:glutaredoxin-like protein
MKNSSDPQIKFYGTRWCPTSKRAKNMMDSNNISYQYVDIDKDPEGRKAVETINNGNRSVPTILFPDGSILVEPSKNELTEKINQYL